MLWGMRWRDLVLGMGLLTLEGRGLLLGIGSGRRGRIRLWLGLGLGLGGRRLVRADQEGRAVRLAMCHSRRRLL